MSSGLYLMTGRVMVRRGERWVSIVGKVGLCIALVATLKYCSFRVKLAQSDE